DRSTAGGRDRSARSRTSTWAAAGTGPSRSPAEILLCVAISAFRRARDPALGVSRILVHTRSGEETHADVILRRRHAGLRPFKAERKTATRVLFYAFADAIAEAQVIDCVRTSVTPCQSKQPQSFS